MGSCLSKHNPAADSTSQAPQKHSATSKEKKASTSTTNMTPARQLLDLISKSLDAVETTCAANGTAVPDLNDLFHPSSEAFRTDPAVAGAAATISAASLQLAAIFTPPQVSLYHVVAGHFKSAALRVCLESNVTEILREAGPNGLHTDAIAEKNNQDPAKLARFLRYLASHHIYREVTPNVFANTRISSMLDTLKPSKDILANPETKHDGTFGLAALASHHLDEAFKASAYAWETVADPATSHSGEPDSSPFARAMGKKMTLWQYYENPEQKFRQKRFDIGMHGIQALQPTDAILGAFDWKSLPKGSVIVDVGGGVGTSALPLARDYPHFNLVVQDLEPVIKNADTLWNEKMPDALKSGRVKLEVQNFFEPQAKRDVSMFLIKQILHDWSDDYCKKFLRNLRDAAGPNTKLLLMESVMPFACHDPSAEDDKSIPGAVPREAPAPLLANFGAVNEMGYNADIDMFLLFNSQERTIRHIDELLGSVGWKVTVVHRQDGDSTFLQSIEAVPK